MTAIQAVSMSADLVLPPDGQIGKVQSVYKDYINVVTASGLFTLFNRGKPQLPFGIEVDFGSAQIVAIDCQLPVAKVNNRLMFGDELIVIGLTDCSRYSCSPMTGCHISDTEIMNRLTFLRNYCGETSRFGGLTCYLRKAENQENAPSQCASSHTVSDRLVYRLRSVVAGIRRNDNFLIVEGAHGLLGVGPGLTPSGDDFLVGFLGGIMSARMETCRAAAVTLANCLAQDAGKFTTNLSAEYIKFAAKGLYHEYFTGLINSFKSGSLTELEQAAKRLITLGHFSGTDLLLGFSYGGMCTIQTEREDDLFEDI